MALTVDPYFFFRGNAREAMEFYKDVFGGELSIQTNGEANMANDERPADQVMHALLDGDVRIMASDTAKASEKAAKISISISGDDEEKLRGYFDGLSQGGSVFQPLEKMFWGDTYGQVSDKYSIDWMVNITQS